MNSGKLFGLRHKIRTQKHKINWIQDDEEDIEKKLKKIVLRTVCLQPLKAFDSSLSRAPAFKTLRIQLVRRGEWRGWMLFAAALKTCFCLMLSPCWSLATHCVLHVPSVRGRKRFSSKHPIVARGTCWVRKCFVILSDSLLIGFFRNSPFACFFASLFRAFVPVCV